MSSLPVRQSIQTELEAYLATVGVTFAQSINEAVSDGLASPWATLSFAAYGNTNYCFSAGKGAEIGVADVNIYDLAGVGYVGLIGIADGIATHFNGFNDGAGVIVVNVTPPNEATAGDTAGGLYGVVIGLEYQYLY
jgi:hypothetical protein